MPAVAGTAKGTTAVAPATSASLPVGSPVPAPSVVAVSADATVPQARPSANVAAIVEPPHQAMARRGAEALNSGHVRLALSLLRDALAQSEAQPAVHLDLAVALLHLRDSSAALNHLQRAQQLWGSPSQWPAHAVQVAAMIHAQRGDWVRVLSTTDFDPSPADFTLAGVRAAALVQTARWDEALALYDRLVTRAPGEARWWLGRASALRALGRWGDAAAALSSAAEQARDASVLAAVQAQAAALRARMESTQPGPRRDGPATDVVSRTVR